MNEKLFLRYEDTETRFIAVWTIIKIIIAVKLHTRWTLRYVHHAIASNTYFPRYPFDAIICGDARRHNLFERFVQFCGIEISIWKPAAGSQWNNTLNDFIKKVLFIDSPGFRVSQIFYQILIGRNYTGNICKCKPTKCHTRQSIYFEYRCQTEYVQKNSSFHKLQEKTKFANGDDNK